MAAARLFVSLLLVCPSLTFIACESNPTEPPPTAPAKIQTDNEITVATQTVGPGGGTVWVISADPKVSGLQIQVPPNAYPETRTFTISYATITSHEFGEFFRPISPLITISNGGGYADSMLTLKIPVEIADSVYPLAFFYDDENEILEGVPVIAYDKHSVTVGTLHFDVSGIASRTGNSPKRHPTSVNAFSRLVLSMATPGMVSLIAAKKPLLTTRYYPGADDWEFPNYGSYMRKARGGHCAGQNSSSLWYYYEKRIKGGFPMLHHHYDSVDITRDKLWQDNPLGYRFASAVQNDMIWESTMQNIYENWVSMQDDYTWCAFVVSMYLIGEPFDVGIYGHDAQGNRGGHDMTAYSIDVPGRTIYVADPNYPGDRTRTITFNGATFDPYYSGLSAEESNFKFTNIKFSSKTTFIDWDKIGEEYTRCVVNKWNPGFPEYSLWLNGTTGVKIYDSYHSAVDTMDISINWSEPTDVYFTIYKRNGDRIVPEPSALYSMTDRAMLILQPGENLVGFAITGELPDTTYKWVDFRWVRLYFDTTMARIEPETMSGVKLQQYVWSATVTNRPRDIRYEWDWGDGTSKFIANNDSVSYHSYTNDGNYTIDLEVFDRSSNTKVASATGTATISSGIQVTGLWPSSESFAMPVYISGKNFGTSQGSSTVKFGPYPAYSIVSWSPTEIVATVPEMFSGGNVVVTVGGVSSAGFHLDSKRPAIASIKPDSGYPGNIVVIRGEGFGALQGNATVEFHSTEATIVSWSDTTVQAIVPASLPGLKRLFVEVGNGNLDSYDYFKLLENYLTTLHGMNCLQLIAFNTRYKRYSAAPSPHEEYVSGIISISAPLCSLSYMKWNGTSFSQKVTDNTVAGTTEITTISGTVSADGRTIASITVKYEWTRAEYVRVQELSFTNIPVTQSSPASSITYSMTGAGLQGHVVKVSDETTKNGVLYEKYVETDWADQTYVKGIYVTFNND